MEEVKTEKKGLSISAKSFITSLAIIFGLMVICYILTFFIPGGKYVGLVYQSAESGIPFWKWLLSPILVLTVEGSGTLIAVIIFLLVIGGIFNALNSCGLMQYMIEKIAFKFGKKRYLLMAVIMFFFMAMGSLIGSFEECVPLVPIITALSVKLGWDVLTGISMSMLSVGCGFAAGVFNPFTIGVAQELADLPMFSGWWYRLVAFILIYALLFGMTYFHAKKVEKPINQLSVEESTFTIDKKKDKGILWFALLLGFGIVLVMCSPFITFLQDLTMIIVAVMFLVAGIVATLVAGVSVKELLKTFGSGVLGILPAVLMILMASSIKYTLQEANVLDTILKFAIDVAQGLPNIVIILFIYLIVLVMNFFIASGSAKAVMLIPLIVPIAEHFGISAQLCIMAFAFGDGFSNVFYPTNPALLISLGVSNTGYAEWAKHSYKFQLANLLLTSSLLLLGYAIGY